MQRRLADTVAEAAFQFSESAANTAVTVAARLPILAQSLVSPTRENAAEWEQAWSEKLAASWDGAVAAMNAWNVMAFHALWSPPTPVGYAQNAVDLMQAVVTPAQTCVRANAARLAVTRR